LPPDNPGHNFSRLLENSRRDMLVNQALADNFLVYHLSP
jgi:hypothetical protein